eukprot:2258423-Amphidinium_carterae.2
MTWDRKLHAPQPQEGCATAHGFESSHDVSTLANEDRLHIWLTEVRLSTNTPMYIGCHRGCAVAHLETYIHVNTHIGFWGYASKVTLIPGDIRRRPDCQWREGGWCSACGNLAMKICSFRLSRCTCLGILVG